MNHISINRLYVSFLAVAVVLVYAVTLKHGFVWDDNLFTVGNKVYQQFDLKKIFFSLGNSVEYLPLRDLTYALDYLVWGENPFGFHLTNLILFTLETQLIYLFSAELPFAGVDGNARKLTAFCTALLFAVHPLLSESVNWITCRNVLLSGVFFFLATLVFSRSLTDTAPSVSISRQLGMAACFVAALFSKATVIVLPLVLLLLAIYLPSRKTVRRKAALLTPLFVLGGLFFMLFRSVAQQSGVISEQTSISVAARIATALQIPFFYASKFMVPVGYSAEYAPDRFSNNLTGSAPVAAFIALVVLTTVAAGLRRKIPLLGFALLWYGITLLPVLNFFATNPVVADRYAHLPAFAFALLVASLPHRFAARCPKSVTVAVIGVAAGLGAMTFTRNLDWRSDVTLWQANVRTEPANAKGYQNLVGEAINAGNLSLAQQILAEGRSQVSCASYDYLEGRIHYLRHDLNSALRTFEAAVQKDGEHIRSLFSMGLIYHELGRYDEAEKYYCKTLAAKEADAWGCRENARTNLKKIGRSSYGAN